MVFAMRLIETISKTHRIAMPTVQRLRFFYRDPGMCLAFAVKPPPNMSDNPPPFAFVQKNQQG